MGRHAARSLFQADFTNRIVVAGLDDPAARRFTASIGPKAEFQHLDINDRQSLHDQMLKADIVVNTAGPFFRLGRLVADAALATRRDYLDICDDVEPTVALLDRDQEARSAGICMITGMGLSPGILNLLGKKAIEGLDTAHSLDTIWDLSATATVDDGFAGDVGATAVNAALVHWMHVCSGQTKVMIDGEWISVRPVEPATIPLGGGVEVTGWSVTHPEAVTLPRTFTSLRQSRNFMTGRTAIFELLQAMRDQVDAGQIDCQTAARILGDDHGLAASMTVAEEKEYRLQRKTSRPYLAAVAQGTKNDAPARSVVRLNALPPGGMGANTGLPVAIVAEMLATGLVAGEGAFTPEAIVDGAEFFRRLEPYCDKPADGRPLVETLIEPIA